MTLITPVVGRNYADVLSSVVSLASDLLPEIVGEICDEDAPEDLYRWCIGGFYIGLGDGISSYNANP